VKNLIKDALGDLSADITVGTDEIAVCFLLSSLSPSSSSSSP